MTLSHYKIRCLLNRIQHNPLSTDVDHKKLKHWLALWMYFQSRRQQS